MSISRAAPASGRHPGPRDKRRLARTRTPGVYKRIDGEGRLVGYVCVFCVAGRQRKRHACTYAAARRMKRESETDRDRGQLQEFTAIAFLRYLDEWVERYRGQGRRGFRENTREEYRRLIKLYAHSYFPVRLRLTDLTPYKLARFVDWLADEEEQGKRLADSTVANIVIPLRAALATATREGLIHHNPAQGLALPYRDQITGDDKEAKVFSREQLAAVLAMAPERHRLLFEILASCGLRISEAIALQRQHLQLDGSKPELHVRRAIVRERVELPKTKHGRREIRLPPSLALRLRAHLADQVGSAPTALLFTNGSGGVIDPNNLRRRIFKPLAEEAGAPWAAFHTFRHTFASIHLRNGTKLLQLSRALGHHSAAFTLTHYAHLAAGDGAPPLDLADTCSMKRPRQTTSHHRQA